MGTEIGAVASPSLATAGGEGEPAATMVPERQRTSEFELRRYLRVLRRRWRSICLGVMLVVGTVLIISFLQTEEYQATATVVFQPSRLQIVNTQITQSLDPTRDVQTQIDVLESPAVRARVAATLHRPLAPPIAASADTKSNAMHLVATSTDPVEAAAVANAYATTYTDYTRGQNLQYLTSVGNQLESQIQELQHQLDVLNKQLAVTPIASPAQSQLLQQSQSLLSQQTNLQQTLNQVQAAAAVPSGVGELVTPATVPSTPSSPKPIRDGLLGLVIGLLFGIALALVRDYFNDSITSKEDLDHSARGVPLIGIVPVIPGPRANPPEVVSITAPTSAVAEAFRTLRVTLQFLSSEQKLRVVQVTSPGSGEGKTTTVANLGVALANAGLQVCLCCCDLRRPRLHEFFDLSTEFGLSSFLGGQLPLSRVLQRVPEVEGLMVLPAGPPIENPTEALSSSRTTSLLKALRLQFDIVLLDSPPVLPVADAMAISEVADATILLATVGRTNRRGLSRAVELLRTVDAPILGTVLNRVSDTGTYGYREGYESYYQPEARKSGNNGARRGLPARANASEMNARR